MMHHIFVYALLSLLIPFSRTDVPRQRPYSSIVTYTPAYNTAQMYPSSVLAYNTTQMYPSSVHVAVSYFRLHHPQADGIALAEIVMLPTALVLLSTLLAPCHGGGLLENTDGLLTPRLELCCHLIDPLLVRRVEANIPFVGIVHVEPGHISGVIAGVQRQ